MIDACPIDKSLGMDYYIYEGLDLSDVLEFRKSPDTFKVFEISLDGVKAAADICVESDVVVDTSRDYLHYVLCKEGVDTFYAIQLLKRFFGVAVGYAGLKDSDSHSCQFISLSVKHLKRLRGSIMTHHSLGPLKLCYYRTHHYPVRRGYLLGNLFNIFLHFKGSRDAFERKLDVIGDSLKVVSLPNYYGYQRFGTIRPITHLVGSAIVRKAWDEAVRLIAGSPHVLEGGRVVRARGEFESGNFREALKLFPTEYWIERRVCRAMMRWNDALKAINSLPMEIRDFYVEAYQSYLFNKALSKALKYFGSVEGVAEGCETLVVPGVNAMLRDDVCSSFVLDVMEGEGVSREDFAVKDLGIVCKSYVRESTFKVWNLSLRFSSDGVWMEFVLPRGCYASIFLREILKDSQCLGNDN